MIQLEAQTLSSTLLGAQFGTSKYLGELDGSKKLFNTISPNQNTFFAGFNFMVMKKDKLAFQVFFNTGNLAGDDKNAKYSSSSDFEYQLYLRNLNFKTTISEYGIATYVYPFKFLKHSDKKYNFKFQPYAFLGIGQFKFNPIGTYYDQLENRYYDVELAPLNTEGQGFVEFPDRSPYKLTQLNIPYGVGISYMESSAWMFSFEINSRKLFTDYLDDVSKDYIDPSYFDNNLTEDNAVIAKSMSRKYLRSNMGSSPRGNSKTMDSYFTYSLKLQFAIKQKTAKKQTIYRYDDIEICL